jgi:hypothetical protein
VSTRVFILTWLITLSVGLLGLAGIITPLGLSQSIKPSNSPVDARFEYSLDAGPFGYGTGPRYNRFSRLCGALLYMNCPGRDDGYDYIRNSTGMY